jgi:hypothetical protein
MQILDVSTHQLGKLKEQIEPLVLFFNTILADMGTTFDIHIKNFLGSIERGIKPGAGVDEIEAVKIGATSKKVSL